jgi:ribose transport system permease protein
MKRKNSMQWILEYGIVFMVVLLILFFSITAKNFLSINVMVTILRQVAITGIVSVGMTFVMLTGGIDLSVGAISGLTGIIASTMMLNGSHTVLSCAVALISAAVLGAINAFLITKWGLPPLIATLGIMTSARGLAFIISGGFSVINFNPNFTNFSKASLWFIPYPVLFTALIFLLAYFILNKMRIGRYIYGVGGNEEASRLSGINVNRIKLFAYMFSGVLAGIAGLVYLSRLGSGQAGAGTGYEMDAITAVVLGGVSISGGEGKVGMVAIGVLIMGILSSGMVMLNINDYVQQVVRGLVMICAVALSQYTKRIRNNISVNA